MKRKCSTLRLTLAFTLVLGCALVAPAAEPFAPKKVMQAKGRFLYDPNGEKVVLRGIDNCYFGPNDGGDRPGFDNWTKFIVPEIERAGFNMCEVVSSIRIGESTQTDRGHGISLQEFDDQLKVLTQHGLIVELCPRIIGEAFARGTREWEFWFANALCNEEIKKVAMKYEDYLIISAHGESHSPKDEDWVADNKKIIDMVRGAGYRCPISLYSMAAGRSLPCILKHGKEVFDYDPLKNVIFGVQAYWPIGDVARWQKVDMNNTPDPMEVHTAGLSLTEAMRRIAQLDFPVLLGLDLGVGWYAREDNFTMMKEAQELQLNWHWWDWYNPFGQNWSLTRDGKYGHWCKPYGEAIVAGPYGAQQTSVRTRYFQEARKAAGIKTVDPDKQPSAPGLQVHGKFLYDKNGERVMVRGINNVVSQPLPETWHWHGFPAELKWSELLPETAKTGANLAALDVLLSENNKTRKPLSIAEFESMLGKTICLGMIAAVGFDLDSNNPDTPATLGLLLRDDVKAALRKYEDGIILRLHVDGARRQVGGKMTGGTDEEWAASCADVIGKLRGAGYKCPIALYPRGGGHEISCLLNKGDEVAAKDLLKNTMFCLGSDWACMNRTYLGKEGLPGLSAAVETLAGRNYPVLLDLKAYAWEGDIEYGFLLRAAQESHLGWFWSTWNTQGTAALALTGKFGEWSEPYAEDVCVRSQYGIQKTSVKTKFFKDQSQPERQ